MYIQDGFNDIQSSSRCRMYKEIKQVHKPEAYLTVNINNKVCTSFTKFMLSSHKLLAEQFEQFVDAGKKYFKKYIYKRPSMAKFVELMNTKSDCVRYRLMLFVILFVA